MPRMHLALRKLIDVVWQVPLTAIPFAVFFGLMFGARFAHYVLAYKLSLVFGYSVSLGLWAVKQFVRPRLQRREEQEGREYALQIGVWIAATCTVASYVAAYIIHRTLLPGFLGGPRQVAISGMFTLVFMIMFGGVNYAIVFYRKAVERARAVERMRAELAQAELRALRAQVNPHFLFNTLNSIAALISENPGAAEDVTTRLAEIFRYALAESGRDHARLGDELQFLRNYLEIERTRFAERLRVEEAIEPGLESTAVPSLLLQPLVENAIHHAISPRPEGGRIRLAARRAGDLLVLEVSDDGPGIGADPPSGTGFGLRGVRERLRVLGPPHAITVESAPGRGTRITLTLPLTPASAGSPTPLPPPGDPCP